MKRCQLTFLQATLFGVAMALGDSAMPARLDAAQVTPALQPPAVNYQGLWWAAPAGSESGWGLNIAHQGDVLFVTWFAYAGADGAIPEFYPQWYSITANKTADGVYSGEVIRTTGPSYSTSPFDPSAVVLAFPGEATLTFTSATTGTFSYVMDGNPGSKAIVMQAFGPLPTCVWGAQADLTKATNYTDLWWASGGAEPGWGVNLAHQGDVIFATWFTYPYWMSATAVKVAPNTFSGTLYRTTGPSCCSTFDPSAVEYFDAGNVTFTFADGNNATFFYDVNIYGGSGAASQVKLITRQVFRPPGTVCQ